MTGSRREQTRFDFSELPSLRVSDKRYDLPATEHLHQQFVQYSVENENDICVISPSLRSEFLDHLAIGALFQDLSTLTPVFIISPNTSIRDRYEQLQNGYRYSTERWPLATVKSNHQLAYRTEHARSDDAPPGIIFTRFSTRLPYDAISQDIRVVLYDDAVKFEEERWENFQNWRERNGIASVVYFIRDPLGDLYEHVKDDTDATWAWTPHALESTLDNERKPDESGVETVPAYAQKERTYLRQKTAGQTHQVQLCSEGPVVEAFSELWTQREELRIAADDIDEKQLHAAVGIANRAISGFSRLTTKLQYSDNYRAEHGKATTLSGRIAQVETTLNNLTGDAAAGGTPVEHVHHALEQLKKAIVESSPRDWKRGAVLTAMQKTFDDDGHLIVVLPDEPERDALQADLRIERPEFYSKARKNIHLHTPRSLPSADPADYLLLYGPPKYDHRWLLRTPHAEYVGILAYPHELGLLHSQIASMNRALRNATPTPDSFDADDLPSVFESASLPELLDSIDTQTIGGSPTSCGPFDGITLDIPDPDDYRDETDTTPFDEYELLDTGEQQSVDELIRDVAGSFTTQQATFTPSEDTASSSSEHQSHPHRRPIEGCIDLKLTSGKAMALRPSDKLEVVNIDAGTTVEKSANSIRPGEEFVSVNDRDRIREEVEKLLLDAGYLDLVGNARLWKHQLKTEIKRHDDTLEDFIEKVEAEGLDKTHRTYDHWYHRDIHLPKARKSLHAIAQAYEIEEVLDEFDAVWRANHKIRQLKNKLIDLLKQRARNALTEQEGGDHFLDEQLDIRLSDFDTTDEHDNPFVEVHTVAELAEDVTLPRSYIGRVRTPD